MAKKSDKTNAMRLLDQAGIAYQEHSFKSSGAISGTEVAAVLGEDPNRVFKTLVTVGKSGAYYVFMVPVEKELDLKKAARAVSEKSVEMVKSKELLPLTGYIHGGCSPIGMKKLFKTAIHQTAEKHKTIFFSGGRLGLQIETTFAALATVIPIFLCDLCKD